MTPSAVSGQPSVAQAPPAIFQAYPALAERLAWMSIGNWPTPITEARQFATAKGLRSLYLKREDLSHPECGGNKVRGLEFLLADARRRWARSIVTLSAAGSHHIVKTAWHARPLGMETIGLVVHQPPAAYVRENLLVGSALGVRYVPCNYATLPVKLLMELLRSHRLIAGATPYFVPPGGTSLLSALGHVSAALELRRQIDAGVMPEPDYLYVALGSLGTAAGLAAGCALAGLRCRLVGVVTSHRWYCTTGRWARLARRTIRLMRRFDPAVPEAEVRASDLSVITTALGAGYGHATPESAVVVGEMRGCEGIELDGTYTGKTLDGAMRFIRERRLEDRVHLFWQSYACTRMPSDGDTLGRELPPGLRRYL